MPTKSQTTLSLAAGDITEFRLLGNGLLETMPSLDAVVEQTVGIQAQDLSAAMLAIRARCPSANSAEVQHALLVNRSIVKVWSLRNTLHLHRTSDWPLVFSALSGKETSFEKAAAKRCVDLASFRKKADSFIEASSSRPSFDYSDLKAADLGLGDFPVEGWSAGWGDLCLTLERRGPICHGGSVKGRSQFVHARQWVPTLKWSPPPRKEAFREIIVRYLAAYGPASTADIAHWFGFARNAVDAALDHIGKTVVRFELGGEQLLAHKDFLKSYAKREKVRVRALKMLGKYDPLLLAYESKDWLVDASNEHDVWRSGGRIEAVILFGRQVVGTWRYKRRTRTLDISAVLFRDTPELIDAELNSEASEVSAFFGLELGELECRRSH